MKDQGQQWKSRIFTIFLTILLVATQILIVINIKNYFFENSDSQPVNKNSGKSYVRKTNTKLKPLRVDTARFEIEVIKPHRDMKSKFPNHPDMIINKLSKILQKEENK